MRSLYIFLIISNCLISAALSQVVVDDSGDISEVVKSLEGPGVKIFNIKYHGKSNPRKPYGKFTDATKNIGLGSGLLITSGSAVNAVGPNTKVYNHQGATQDNKDKTFDADLAQYSYGKALTDLCYVEFDFRTSSELLTFNYVFASEEYTDYLEYSDVFAFIISGPGITGSQNLAVIPGTNTEVSVSTINNKKNSKYYISNEFAGSPKTQYDGYTKVLTAKTIVQPCQTYHIKLAIADASKDASIDPYLDSGVFIEQGSFRAENPPTVSVRYQFPKFPFAIEGCNKANILFVRNPVLDKSIELKYKLTVQGTATSGIDYTGFPDSLIIPSGKDSVEMTVDFFQEDLPEDNEYVDISMSSGCPDFPELLSVRIPVKDYLPHNIPSAFICKGEFIDLNKNYEMNNTYYWESNPRLSCIECPSPTANVEEPTYFHYSVTDNESQCQANDSVFVNVKDVKADFVIAQEPCYTSLDLFFRNQSSNAQRYEWYFGDGGASEDENPLHTYTANQREAISYRVKLIAKSNYPQCSAEITKNIEIAHPLFLPNLITPNNDGKNDYFEIQGIGNECWKLVMYNRWGAVIYEKENYNNDFNAEGFGEGAYYFHLENGPKDREYKGWLNITGKKE